MKKLNRSSNLKGLMSRWDGSESSVVGVNCVCDGLQRLRERVYTGREVTECRSGVGGGPTEEGSGGA
jgi:hypothetical protein